MSDWQETQKRIVVERYMCSYCKAKPGDWCRTGTGKKAEFLHKDRTAEMNEFMWAVYRDAADDAKVMSNRLLAQRDETIRELRRKVSSLENFQTMWVGGA